MRGYAWFVSLLPPARPRPTNITLSVLQRHSLQWLKHKDQGERWWKHMLARNVNDVQQSVGKLWIFRKSLLVSLIASKSMGYLWVIPVIPVHLFSQALWKCFDVFHIFLKFFTCLYFLAGHRTCRTKGSISSQSQRRGPRLSFALCQCFTELPLCSFTSSRQWTGIIQIHSVRP